MGASTAGDRMTWGVYCNNRWYTEKDIRTHIKPYIREGVNTAPLMADRLFGANAYTGQSVERDHQVIAFRRVLAKMESEGEICRVGTTGLKHHPTTIWAVIE